MCSSKTDKSTFRKTYLAKRSALNSSQLIAYNQRLCDWVLEYISWEQVRVLHVYLPMLQKHEVDTYPIIEHVRASHKHVIIAVPKVASDSDALKHFIFTETTTLEVNQWGIPEPVASTPVTPDTIDLVLVPLLVFDKSGHRIGYGKGHYDRFLAQCRQTTQKIGLSYFEPVERIEVEPTDIPMDAVVTPKGVWEF